jgi:hypothetical protein
MMLSIRENVDEDILRLGSGTCKFTAAQTHVHRLTSILLFALQRLWRSI